MEEKKILDFINLIEDLSVFEFSQLCQQAEFFYSCQKSKAKLSKEDLTKIEESLKKRFV